jgi:hypothetical protein
MFPKGFDGGGTKFDNPQDDLESDGADTTPYAPAIDDVSFIV